MADSPLPSPPPEPPDPLPSSSVEMSTNQSVDPGAKNPVVSSPAMDKSTPSSISQNKSPYLRYDVDFEVTNCTDAALFLSEFLSALNRTDKAASVLLSTSTSEDQKIGADTIFPANTSKDPSRLETFVMRYIGDLRRLGTSMKGMLTVHTRMKFATLNNKEHIQVFHKGAWSGSESKKPTKVWLLLNTLGCIRHSVGFLLNTIMRRDMVTSMSQQIDVWLDNLKEDPSKDFPPFQAEFLTMHRDGIPAIFYRIMTAKRHVATLAKALEIRFPKPSVETCFISSKRWEKFPPERKMYYHKMHLQYQDGHSSFLLRGFKDSSVEIAMAPNSDKRISVRDWLKCQTLPGASTGLLFNDVEPHVSSGNIGLTSTKANEGAVKDWIPHALAQIGLLATDASLDQIFLDPAQVRKEMKVQDGPIKPTAKARASSATGRSGGASPVHASAKGADSVLNSFLEFDKSEELLIPRDKNKSTDTRKRRNVKKDGIVFCNVAAIHAEHSPTASDVNLESSKKPKKRRQRKKKKTQESASPPIDSSSKEPPASIPVAPSKVVSAIAEQVMDEGVDDDATTTSVQSNRSYASVVGNKGSSSATLPIPTVVNGATESPSSVPASGEVNTYISEIAALKREAVLRDSKIADRDREAAARDRVIARLKEQLATRPRPLKAVPSTPAPEISDPSFSASTPEATPDEGYTFASPPRPLRRTKVPLHTPPSDHGYSHPSKKARNTATPNRYDVLAETEDDEDIVDIAASQVQNLTLDNTPRSPSSESGMPL
jgi:hypothetical protein